MPTPTITAIVLAAAITLISLALLASERIGWIKPHRPLERWVGAALVVAAVGLALLL